MILLNKLLSELLKSQVSFTSIIQELNECFEYKERKNGSNPISIASRLYLTGLSMLANGKDKSILRLYEYRVQHDSYNIANSSLSVWGEKLTHTTRTGWKKHGVFPYENVADHSFGIISLFLIIDKVYKLSKLLNLNKLKIIKMLLIHDLAESISGDLVHEEGTLAKNISLSEKQEIEKKAAQKILVNHPDLLELWFEYENLGSAEAKWAKQLDKLEALLQAIWYVKQGRAAISLFKEFSASTKKHLVDNPLLLTLYNYIVSEATKEFHL